MVITYGPHVTRGNYIMNTIKAYTVQLELYWSCLDQRSMLELQTTIASSIYNRARDYDQR
jgi:hypothetical protein